jgi:hypothetical protein
MCPKTYTESASRSVMAGKDQRLDRSDKHVPCLVIHESRCIAVFVVIVRNGVVNGVVFALICWGCRWPVEDSIIHEATNIAVEGASILPLLVVSTRADVVQVSRPEVLRGERRLFSEEVEELVIILLCVALDTPRLFVKILTLKKEYGMR